MIKNYTFDKAAYDAKAHIAAKNKEHEREAQELAAQILRDHFVTATRAEDTLKQAADEMSSLRKEHIQSEAVKENFKNELLQHKKRLVQLELQGILNLSEEVADKEELMQNGGKRKSYFKAPQTTTKLKLMNQAEQDEQLERLYQEQLARKSKFVITDLDEHFNLKNLIKRRMVQLSAFLMSEGENVPSQK